MCAAIAPSVAARGGDWPQFRGANRDNISTETGLLRKWPEGGPKVLWSTEVCQGYAAAAIYGGRVYFEDYERDAKQWCLRCLSLADGKELWRLRDSKTIRPNHGITRATPATDGKYVFSLDPKCVFHCVDAETGKELWRKDLVEDYKAQIPPWYNGQNPLLDGDRVILGVGGEALLVALEKASGKEIWRTPNPVNWPLSHSSVMPAELCGVKQYVWCTLLGPLGVRAEDGKLLWHHARKFNVAVATSPLPIPPDRVFMTAGYDAGSIMVRLRKDAEGRFTTEAAFELTTEQWNSEVHTPILYKDHLFAVGRKSRGLLTCLDLDGKIVWTSEGQTFFGLGSFLLADGMFYVLEGDTGMLRLVEASTSGYRELDHAAVLSGDNVWGPMALSGSRLIVRDMSKMVCLEVAPAATAYAGGAGLLCLLTIGNANCSLLPVAGEEPKMRYHKQRVISGEGAGAGQFADALRGLTVSPTDYLYAVGDSKLVVFSPAGELVRHWATERPASSVAVAVDGTVYVGEEGQIEVFDHDGQRQAAWRDAARLGLVTAIGLTGDNVLIADAKDRCIRRYDKSGKFLNNIGKDNKMRGFVLPNGYLDFAVDAGGTIHAANPGQHRVERYSLDGKLLGRFGRFDGVDPEGFPGCCNPTNLALLRPAALVVTEKAGPRVKVYTREGKLLLVLGVQDFDPNCKNMDVAVDSRGRIYVVDTVRLQIVVYEADSPAASQSTAAPEEPRP